MSPISLSSPETRVKVSSPNYYDFKNFQYWPKLSASCTAAHVLKMFYSCLEYTRFLIPWYTHPVLKKCILT